jgi:membrane fusion protein, multidrug efflux system
MKRIPATRVWPAVPGIVSGLTRTPDLPADPIAPILRTLPLAFALVLAGCGGGGSAQDKAKGKGPSGPTQVGFVVVQPTSEPVNVELAGRVNAYQTAEIRPQVSGVIQRRFFTEGAIVRQGQTLYQVDPSLYRASVNQAQANLRSAQANAEATAVRAQRLKPLAEMEAVAKQDYTDAEATARQAQASVAQNRAQLETARINLRFTNVPAPITGRIGRSLFTQGALVTANQADPLAVIQRLDPIFVDIQQSSAEMLALRRALSQGGLMPTRAQVRLKLEDGSDYGLTGSVEFAEVQVDPATGTVTLRAVFSNPNGVLLPGMFVRANFAQAINTRVYLVPQQAVTREANGTAFLFVVGANNKAERRNVEIERAVGANWVVTKGLNPGDRVIVQGTGQLRPNADIRPVPATNPQNVAPPQQKQGGGDAAKGKQG